MVGAGGERWQEELRQRYLAPPYGRLFGFMMAEQCYDTLPNRRPGIGNIDELNAATLTACQIRKETRQVAPVQATNSCWAHSLCS